MLRHALGFIVLGLIASVGLCHEGVADEKADSGIGATHLKVVNATTEKVEVRVNNGSGSTTNFQFLAGMGHFEPTPLLLGVGDRVVSVRLINGNGTIALPSKVLAVSKFDPANAAQSVLVLTFIRGIAGDEIIYTVSAVPGVLGNSVKGSSPVSPEQTKSIEEILKMPALKAGGN